MATRLKADTLTFQNSLPKPKQTSKRNDRRGASKSRPASPKNREGDAAWDQAALWYDALVGMRGSEYQQSLILPGALSLLQLQKKEKALDVACGQGVFCRYLHEKGFKAEGLDVSSALIEAARRRSPKALSFHHADAADPKALEGATFDAVSCLLAVQNIEHLVPVLKNVRRWLKPSGRFVMVVTHPCFRIPRQSHWEYDEGKKIQYRRVDLYATETEIPIVTPPKRGARGHTTTYHRPLQVYFEALASAGLAVDRLEEWTSGKTSEPGKRAKAENRARQEFPLFLALRAIPVNNKAE